MSNLRKLLVLLTISLLFTQVTLADILEPVKWTKSFKKLDNSTYELKFTANIDKGWHMYGLNIPDDGPIATSFNYTEDASFALVGEIKPSSKPKEKYDNTFLMDIELFGGNVSFTQKVSLKNASGIIKGYIVFMACDDSRCLPPSEEEFEFNLSADLAESSKNDDSEKQTVVKALPERNIDIEIESEPITDAIATNKINASNINDNADKKDVSTTPTTTPKKDSEANKPLWLLFLQSILGGLGAILTPCVYPIIPLTVTFFSSGSSSKFNTIVKALTFGISLIGIYALVGLVTGIFQIDLMTAITSHWLPNVLIFLLFLTFAASFFGAFEIMLPNKWANKIDQKADKGGVVGAFFMALATAVVSFSCTGPIAGIFLGNALKGDIIDPVVGMSGFGLGFALPFTIMAFFPQALKKLPKSGGWLNAVKVVFAFLMLAFSLIFLSQLGNGAIPRDFILALAIAIFTLNGLYLIGKIKFSHDSDLPYVSIPRILLAILSWAIAIYLVTGMFGAPLKSISTFLPAKHTLGINLSNQTQATTTISNSICDENPKWSDKLHLPHGIKGYFDWEEALNCAKEQNKPVLVDFVGHSCKNCKKMYEEVIQDPAVLNKIKTDFIMLAMYTDDRSKLPENEWITSTLDDRVKKTLGKKNLDFQVTNYNSNALPMYVIVNPNGEILTTTVQYYTYNNDIKAFLSFLNEGLKNFK